MNEAISTITFVLIEMITNPFEPVNLFFICVFLLMLTAVMWVVQPVRRLTALLQPRYHKCSQCKYYRTEDLVLEYVTLEGRRVGRSTVELEMCLSQQNVNGFEPSQLRAAVRRQVGRVCGNEGHWFARRDKGVSLKDSAVNDTVAVANLRWCKPHPANLRTPAPDPLLPPIETDTEELQELLGGMKPSGSIISAEPNAKPTL